MTKLTKKRYPTLVKKTKFIEGEAKIFPYPTLGIKTGYKSERLSVDPKSLLAKKVKSFKVQ